MDFIKHPLLPEVRVINGVAALDKIYLTIRIGNGQLGGSKVVLNSVKIAKGDLSQPALLGDSATLLDKEIEIETNVLDVNKLTNQCVITTTFQNQDNKILYSKIDSGNAPDSGVASFNGKYKLTLIALLFFVLSCFYTTNSFAQTTADQASFDDLETPSSPGFIILDKAPSAIERPTTPKGFAVNALGLFQGTGGAMEFAPFWLVNHPKLTAEMMYNKKMPFLYNFSVSAATVKTDSTSYLATGFRTRLFQSYSKNTTSKLDSVKNQISLALADIDFSNPDFSTIETLQATYMDLIEKPIFTIDLAAAMGGGSSTNSFKNLGLDRWSAWMSLNWRPKGNDFYTTVLARFINNDNFESYTTDTDLFDIGARFNYDIAKLCISFEYLQRMNLNATSRADNRLAAIGSYKLSDKFFFTATFGKNFSDVNNIIALAGINFGFSQSKMKAY